MSVPVMLSHLGCGHPLTLPTTFLVDTWPNMAGTRVPCLEPQQGFLGRVEARCSVWGTHGPGGLSAADLCCRGGQGHLWG